MFRLFKFSKSVSIPSDIIKGLMTSSLCKGVKLGSKISIPKDIICLVSYKDKVYKILETGNYTINETLAPELYDRQAKKRKIKKLNIDFFFVNRQNLSISTNFKDKIPVERKMTKFNINIMTDINVYKPETFAKYVLNDVATITAEESLQLFCDYIEIFTRNYLVKVELNDYELPNDIKLNYKDKLTKYLTKIGVTLNKLDIVISTKNPIEKKSNFFNHLDTETNTDTPTIDTSDTTNSLQTHVNESTNTEGTKDRYCANCNMKLIEGSIYCHRCGYVVKTQNSEGDNYEKIQKN